MFWFAAACSTPKPEVLMERQYAFVQSEKEQTLRYQELLRIDLKAEGYDEHPPLAENFLYHSLRSDTLPNIELALNFKVDSNRVQYRFLDIHSGVFLQQTVEARSVHAQLLLPLKVMLEKRESSPERLTAYAYAPWFRGPAVHSAHLLRHVGMYFSALENKGGFVREEKALPLYLAGSFNGGIEELTKGSSLGLSCSAIDERVYRCEIPELKPVCLEQSYKWERALYARKDTISQQSEGMFRSVFRSEVIELCMPSGCYQCDGQNCANKSPSTGLPVYINDSGWGICLGVNFDADLDNSLYCFNDTQLTQEAIGLYRDDCVRQ